MDDYEYQYLGWFCSRYEMEREWKQIKKGNGNKNDYICWVFGSSHGMKMKMEW